MERYKVFARNLQWQRISKDELIKRAIYFLHDGDVTIADATLNIEETDYALDLFVNGKTIEVWYLPMRKSDKILITGANVLDD